VRKAVLALALLASASTAQTAANTHDRIVKAADAAFRLWVEEQPLSSLKYGPPAQRLYDPSPDARADEAKRAAVIAATIADIDSKPLSLDDQLLLDRTRWVLAHAQMLSDVSAYSFPIDGYSSPLLGAGSFFAGYPLKTAEQRAGYLALLKDAVRLVGAMQPRLEAQAAQGIAVPSMCLAASAETWKTFSTDDLVPDADRLKDVPPADAAGFTVEVKAIIETELKPAIVNYTVFATGPFRTRTSPRIGMAQYPGGREAYAKMVASELTSAVSPETINAIGLREGAKLRAQTSRMRAALGYRGDMQGFMAYLRAKRPGDFAKTRDDLGKHLSAYVARMQPKLKDWFARVPSSPFLIKPMPAALEASVTYGWEEESPEPGGPGTYFYNGTPGRPLFNAALAWHEGLPGHHFQYLNATAPGVTLHPIEREVWASFFSEGWAVYATSLSTEMGVNTSPLDRYDVAQDSAFMTNRLAVDTGLNALGWSYQQAHDYMATNTGVPEDEIKSELRRYACESPAQALGYQYGRLAIAKARTRAEKALGKKFNVRAFHTAVLTHGELGADGLERIVDDLIAKAGR
jgi:uncharacterized protein (DUF885 family)